MRITAIYYKGGPPIITWNGTPPVAGQFIQAYGDLWVIERVVIHVTLDDPECTVYVRRGAE